MPSNCEGKRKRKAEDCHAADHAVPDDQRRRQGPRTLPKGLRRNRHLPPSTRGRAWQPIWPYLTINGADKALEFYQKAFGATDIFRHPGEDGRLFHARMTI